VRLQFGCDESGIPISVKGVNKQEANILVEEFMLLANMATARRIAHAFPDTALLRRHPAPLPSGLEEFKKFCLSHGWKSPFDTSSARAIEAILSDTQTLDERERSILSHKLIKAMQSATYFCTADFDQKEWGHYALATTHYTHFTSPIRRYPDILVHRLLQQAWDLEPKVEAAQSKESDAIIARIQAMDSSFLFDLGPGLKRKRTPELDELQRIEQQVIEQQQKEVQNLCASSNSKKSFAKKAQEESDKICMAIMLRNQHVLTEAIIFAGGDRHLNLWCPEYGIQVQAHKEDVNGQWSWDQFSQENQFIKQVSVAFTDGQHVRCKLLGKIWVRLFTTSKKVPLEIRAWIIPGTEEKGEGKGKFTHQSLLICHLYFL